MQTVTFQDLKQNAEEIQKKLDKYEQTLFRIYNSEKGDVGQESFVKYLTDSIEFYRVRQSRLTGLMDSIIGQSLAGSYYPEPQLPTADDTKEGYAEKNPEKEVLGSPDEEDLFDDEDKE